jgi:hypothetical protein
MLQQRAENINRLNIRPGALCRIDRNVCSGVIRVGSGEHKACPLQPHQRKCFASTGGNAQRSRHALNADTIREMRLAFRRGGRKAIDKVMKNKPDIFLKLLVLLVPREMKVEHTGGVKAMTDEQLEQGIEAITAMLAARESRRRGAGDRRCARAGGVAGPIA